MLEATRADATCVHPGLPLPPRWSGLACLLCITGELTTYHHSTRNHRCPPKCIPGQPWEALSVPTFPAPNIGESKSYTVWSIYRRQPSIITPCVHRFQRYSAVISYQVCRQQIIILVCHYLRHHPPNPKIQHLGVHLRASDWIEFFC
jgi:hypothetical protein